MMNKLFKKRVLKSIVNLFILSVFGVVILSNSFMPFLIRGQGYSMFPTITHDSVVFTIPYSLLKTFGYEPRVGDIIVFKAPALPPVWCHRIIGEVNDAYVTQGDHNPQADPFQVKRDAILGVVPQIGGKPIAIPRLGFLIGVLNSNYLVSISLVSVLVVFSFLSDRNVILKRLKPPRQTSRKLSKPLLFSVFALTLFTVMFLPALPYSGYASVAYQVEEEHGLVVGDGGSINFGVVKLGTTVTKNLTLANNWVFPSIACFRLLNDAYDEVVVSPSYVVISPFKSVTINITVTAKDVHGWTRLPMAVSVTPLLLPGQVIYRLLGVNSFLPAFLQALYPAVFASFFMYCVDQRKIRLAKCRTLFFLLKYSVGSWIKSFLFRLFLIFHRLSSIFRRCSSGSKESLSSSRDRKA